MTSQKNVNQNLFLKYSFKFLCQTEIFRRENILINNVITFTFYSKIGDLKKIRSHNGIHQQRKFML